LREEWEVEEKEGRFFATHRNRFAQNLQFLPFVGCCENFVAGLLRIIQFNFI
jgi:hypothetical protein